jgi:hypothetical protein
VLFDVGAERSESTILEDAQERDLAARAQAVDLVQEQDAAAGTGDEARVGACVRR